MAEAEKREFMPPPSALRGEVDWQRDGWEKPWKPFLDWAAKSSPGTLDGIREAENKLAEARKVGHESSKIVCDAKGWLARSYLFLEERYHDSFRKNPRY